jgi:hypothetical protein
MTNAIEMLAMFAAKAAMKEKEATIPEPEFKPFRFPARAARAATLAPANTARAPRTLEELGVPRELARELELALRGTGLTRGDRVTGFTFRAVDGTRYDLRTAAPAAREAGKRAA